MPSFLVVLACTLLAFPLACPRCHVAVDFDELTTGCRCTSGKTTAAAAESSAPWKPWLAANVAFTDWVVRVSPCNKCADSFCRSVQKSSSTHFQIFRDAPECLRQP